MIKRVLEKQNDVLRIADKQSVYPGFIVVVASELEDPMPFAYEKQPFLDVDHTHGAAVQDFAHKVILNANNFDFTQVRADLFDVQFADDIGAVLPHYLYHYDSVRAQAIFFVKFNLHAGEVKHLSLRWGDPAAGVDPSDASVCLYANRLATAGNLAEFTSSFGTLGTAIVADANAPSGNALEFTGGGSGDSGLQLDLVLPETYEAWLMEAETGTSGAYPASLVEASGALNYYRLGKWSGTGAAQVRRVLAGAGSNFTTAIATNQYPAAGEYVMQQTLVGPARKFVEVGSFSVAAGVQGLAYHIDIGLVYSTSNSVYRLDLDGTQQEVVAGGVSGVSFGDCQIVDLNDGQGLQCYIARFDSTAPRSAIYRFDPNDLASGLTLVADITASFLATDSINALSYDPNRQRWYVGVTRSSYSRCDFYEFSKDFSVFHGRIDASEADWGFQGSDFTHGMLFASEHSAASSGQGKTWWQTYALDESARLAHPSHVLWPQSNDGQGIAYASDQGLWYVLNRQKNPDAIDILRLDTDRSQRLISGRWGYNDQSIGSAALQDQTPPAAQSKIGVGTFRTCRVANLAYIKTTFPLPVNRLPVSTNSTVFPTPLEVISVGNTQHVVSV